MEFDQLVKGRYGADNIDLACRSTFDSADPLSMAAELLARRSANQLADKLMSKAGMTSGVTPAQRKQEEQWLKATARHKVWLPVVAEIMLGQQVHEQSMRQGMIVAPEQLNVRDTRRLGQIKDLAGKLVAQLPADQPFRFRVHVTNERGASLSAHMGGLIYVSEGLLRDRGLNDDDLTLRLAHEIAHVTKRHVLRDFQTKLVDAWAVTEQTQGDLARLTEPGAMLGLVLQRISLGQLLARTFDHGNELEADSCAVALAAKTIGSGSTSSAVSRLAEAFGSGVVVAEGSANHPRSELRLQVMNLQLKGLGGQPAAIPAHVVAMAAPPVGTFGNAVTSGAQQATLSNGASTSKAFSPSHGASQAGLQTAALTTPQTGRGPGLTASISKERLVVELIAQAKEVMKAHAGQGRTQGFALPSLPLGPATGSRQFPYGWMVHDRDGKYVALYDVTEQTVLSFNQALHGQATVMQFGGARGASGRPYGGFSQDAKFWILLPFAYLQAN